MAEITQYTRDFLARNNWLWQLKDRGQMSREAVDQRDRKYHRMRVNIVIMDNYDSVNGAVPPRRAKPIGARELDTLEGVEVEE